MKTFKRIKIISILLFVAIIIFASFFGVYKKEDFRVVNIIKGYNLGMQFTKAVKFTGTVKQEEKEVILDQDGNVVEDDGETEYTEENGYTKTTVPVEDDENINNVDNFKLVKKILKRRLKGNKIGEYKIKLNKETGGISLTLQDNEDVYDIEAKLTQKGEFLIVDKETGETLLDKSHIKSTKVVAGASQEDTSVSLVYLQINFNKEGKKKLTEISNIYVEKKEQVENEDGEMEEIDNSKYINMQLDGEVIKTTCFPEEIVTNVLYIPLRQATTNEQLSSSREEINSISTTINSGELPIEYTFEEEIEPEMNKDKLIILISCFAIVSAVELIFIIIKYKAKGFVTTFLHIGYIALLLLTVRYTNVVTTVPGIVAMGISAIINQVFNYIMLVDLKNTGSIRWETIRKFAIWTIPVYVIAVVLSFEFLTVVNSFGMSLVWGSICMYLYNLTITKTVLEMMNK